MKNLKKIKGDASFRKFFRKKKNNFSSIIVFSKEEKLQNLLNYDAINKILNKNKILAPKLYQENYDGNFLEIEDFGDNTIYKILKKKNTNKILYFKKIIKLLKKIQLIRTKRVKNFKNKSYLIPRYEKKILIKEANLFNEWYVKKNLPKKYAKSFEKEFNKIIRKLSSNLKLKNNIFVHRDFHVSNLMLVNNKIGVIDSQDALFGNKAYDLASLIDDVRLKTKDSFKKKIYDFYIKGLRESEKHKFKNDFEILSVLRNLKIIGIFTRLAIRDNKKKYLRLIPYAWTLINLRINKNIIFNELKELLDKYFKGKLK